MSAGGLIGGYAASRLASNATGSNLTLLWEGTYVGWVGDSIPGTTNAPAQYASSLRSVVSWAISGAGWVTAGAQIPAEYASRVNQTRIIIQGGVNDIIADVTAATLFATVSAFVDARLAEGREVILNNISPFQGYASWSAPRQIQLAAYNASLLAFSISRPAVKFIDIYLLFGDPSAPTQLLPAYNSGDGLHPNTTAGAAWAAAIAAVAP